MSSLKIGWEGILEEASKVRAHESSTVESMPFPTWQSVPSGTVPFYGGGFRLFPFAGMRFLSALTVGSQWNAGPNAKDIIGNELQTQH
jgi:hypothetical protein